MTADTADIDSQIDTALAIKACLEDMKREALEFGLGDLARFIELASLAAGEAAAELGADDDTPSLRYSDALGRC